MLRCALLFLLFANFAVTNPSQIRAIKWKEVVRPSEIARVLLGAADQIQSLEKSGELSPMKIEKTYCDDGKVYRITGIVMNEHDSKDFTLYISFTSTDGKNGVYSVYDSLYSES